MVFHSLSPPQWTLRVFAGSKPGSSVSESCWLWGGWWELPSIWGCHVSKGQDSILWIQDLCYTIKKIIRMLWLSISASKVAKNSFVSRVWWRRSFQPLAVSGWERVLQQERPHGRLRLGGMDWNWNVATHTLTVFFFFSKEICSCYYGQKREKPHRKKSQEVSYEKT